MVYVIQLASRIRTESPDPARELYDIYHCCVYSEKLLMMEQRNCPKHVEFYYKNKFEKLVYLVRFIIRIYHDARSAELQISQVYRYFMIKMKKEIIEMVNVDYLLHLNFIICQRNFLAHVHMSA